MIKMFVYGTLKRGHHNNRFMTETCEFLGEAKSAEPNYSMSGNGVPFLHEGGTQHVKGEIWEVDIAALCAIDRLEGHPHGYCRKKRAFVLDGGEPIEAWVYLVNHKRWSSNFYEGETVSWPPASQMEGEPCNES